MIRFGAWSTLLAVLALQLLVLAALLLRAPANRRANACLALLLIVLAGMLTPYVLGYAGAYDAYPWLTSAPFAVPLAVGPLLFAQGPEADGCYRLDVPANEPRLTPRRRRFSGPVAVLVDAACSSATFQFANAVKTTGVATLVGETSGGNLRGINGGSYFFVRLPGSGLEVDLPLVGYFPSSPQPDRGVIPDRRVAITARDIARGRDPQLAAALAILKS